MTVKELRDLLDWHHDDDVVVIDVGDCGYPREVVELKFVHYPYRWNEKKETFTKYRKHVAKLNLGSVVASEYPSF